jgi:hypothetical protein
MNPQELTRRDFHRLAAAAVGGVVAGAAIGCGEAKPPEKGKAGEKGDDKAGDKGKAATTEVALGDPKVHACRGLNACKTDKNDCAGLSQCATVKHECGGMNDCKYLGGCGSNPGNNECKGKGDCHVPMTADHGDAWKKARDAFEKRMKAAGKTFNPAPDAPAEKPAPKPEGDKPDGDKPDEAKKPDEKKDE